jgi:DNA-binding NarL/FixJ family response regulator
MVPPLPISLVWAIWLAILLVELATPPDVVLGILYGVPLLLGASQRTGRQAWRFLLICCAVTLVNLLLPRPIDHNLVVVLVNRLLVCSGLAATTALVVRNQTLQQQRTALNVELAETQLRSDVIATLAHDLKTPVLGTLASLTMLEKERAFEQVEMALASLLAGASWWDHKATAALRASSASRSPKAADHAKHLDSLTSRERQVLACIAEGDDNRTIAQRLAIGEGTVRSHVHVLLHKLQVSNRTQAALLWLA